MYRNYFHFGISFYNLLKLSCLQDRENDMARNASNDEFSGIDLLLGSLGSRGYQNYAISDNPIIFPENMMVSNQRDIDAEWVKILAARIEETGMFSQPYIPAATLFEEHVRFHSNIQFLSNINF